MIKTTSASAPVVVLCSRGFSFTRRLPAALDYSRHTGVGELILLHCPEEKWGPGFNDEVTREAEARFAQEASPPTITLLLKEGRLEDNLRDLLPTREVRMVFIGKQMLDDRLEAIKTLDAPFYFLD